MKINSRQILAAAAIIEITTGLGLLFSPLIISQFLFNYELEQQVFQPAVLQAAGYYRLE